MAETSRHRTIVASTSTATNSPMPTSSMSPTLAAPKQANTTSINSAADADAVVLGRGERRLLSVRDKNGLAVLATDRALHHRDDHRPGAAWTRLGWEHVERVDWDPQRRRLILTGLTPDGPWHTELPLTDGVKLMLLARERIRWTTLLDTGLELGDLGQAHVTVRREPGPGTLQWVVRLHPDVNRDDPRLAACVDSAIAELRAHAGF